MNAYAKAEASGNRTRAGAIALRARWPLDYGRGHTRDFWVLHLLRCELLCFVFLFLGWARGAVQVLLVLVVVLGRGAGTARVVVVAAPAPLLLSRAGGMWRVRLRLITLAPAGEV